MNKFSLTFLVYFICCFNSIAQIVPSQIQAKLHPSEVFVEIIKEDDGDNDKTDDYYYGKIITKTNTFPRFQIGLCSLLDGRFEIFNHNCYHHNVKDMQSYDAYWKPIQQQLDNILPLHSRIFLFPADVYKYLYYSTIRNPSTSSFLVDEKQISIVTHFAPLPATNLIPATVAEGSVLSSPLTSICNPMENGMLVLSACDSFFPLGPSSWKSVEGEFRGYIGSIVKVIDNSAAQSMVGLYEGYYLQKVNFIDGFNSDIYLQKAFRIIYYGEF